MNNEESIGPILFIVLVIGVLLFSIVLTTSSLHINDPENTRYLLSSISQGLAATFALAFTITLVAIQLASRYTPVIMDQFFKGHIKLYMGLFIISIIFPLFLLLMGVYTRILMYLSLILATICLILLIPFFIYIKEILKPQNLISNIKEDALKKDNISDLILSLYRIATIAHIERDERTVEKSIDVFKKIILERNKEHRKEAIEYLEKLAEDSLDDRYIVSKILKTFREIGIRLAEKSNPDIFLITQYMAHLGWRASDYQRNEIVEDTLISIGKISRELLKTQKYELAAKSLSWIVILGAYGHQKRDKYLETRSIEVLKQYFTEELDLITKSFESSNKILDEHERWVLKKKYLEEFQKKVLKALLNKKN